MLPCQQCLQAVNNGHMWMFYSGMVEVKERETEEGEDGISHNTM